MDQMIGPTQSARGSSRLPYLIRRQAWIVVLCTLLAAAGSAYYLVSKHSSYRALAQVVASPQLGTGTGGGTTAYGPDPLVATHSPSVAQAAARATGSQPADVHLGFVTDTNNTALLDITATGPSSQQAVAAANAAAGAYASARSKELTASAASLDGQLSKVLDQIHQLQAQGGAGVGSATPGTNAGASVQLQAAQATYQTLYTQQQQLYSAAASVQTYSTASNAQRIGSPKRDAAIGVLAGLLVGLGIALLRDRLDDRIRNRADLADVSEATVLTRVPNSPRSSWHRMLTELEGTGDVAAEAVRELRTALRFLAVERPLKTILVTSSAAGEGKSFVAANLAAAWAVAGMRTILVSSDLRAPTIEAKLEIESGGRGLTGAIADVAALTGGARRPSGLSRDHSVRGGQSGNGQAEQTNGSRSVPVSLDLADYLQATELDGLAVLPAGDLPPNPAELLGSRAFEALLEKLESVADVVILDTPPVLAVTDARVLSGLVEGVLFVVAEGQSTKSATRRALDLLGSGAAPVLGIVVNRASHVDVRPYYGITTSKPRRRSGKTRARSRAAQGSR